MTVTTIKATKVVDTALALLEREVVLPATVWRDGWGDYKGAAGDTISIRLPAYTASRKNALRTSSRTRDSLVESKVDITLASRLYKDIVLSDENLELDIVDFTRQVMSPVLRSIVRGYEDEVAALMEDATYANEVEFSETNPLASLRRARKLLNNANVPMADRFLAMGSDCEEYVLNAQTFQENAARAGDASALRDASLGRIAGFTPFISNAIDPGVSFAYHRTAFALATRAPGVPAGAPWGQTMASNGFAIRAVQVLDPATIQNILATEAWVGTKAVTDFGYINTAGKFVPGNDQEDPTTPGDSASGAEADIFVRAVKLDVGVASA